MSSMLVGDTSFGLSVWTGPAGSMDAPHIHDDVELNVATESLEYLIRGERVVVPRGSLVLFWAAQPHQLVGSGPDARVTWLTVPLRDLLGWRLPPRFVQRLLRGELVVSGTSAVLFDPEVLACWREELAGTEFAAETARRDIEAHLRRLAVRGHEAPGPASTVDDVVDRRDRRVALVAAMAAFAAENAFRSVQVGEIAESVHLHPQYAMTLFKRVLGVSIGGYLTTCRINEAQRLLLTTDDPPALVGQKVGYTSVSQFYERFRRVTGTSPASYRRQRTER